ncbi:hypothetical protein ROZALSC1DRAFT_22976 [Rozella allomycis CSF55]|uniref:Uncharacterized protein n=1 Tax=Rozella allomycis (strain CSF55) TaxID=988480 RepID=A0A4P9YGQ5_ROZAC|nr:hypothetical protein ROZALSC1DRAFT_22976 [Rozella allomycis CSF55]
MPKGFVCTNVKGPLFGAPTQMMVITEYSHPTTGAFDKTKSWLRNNQTYGLFHLGRWGERNIPDPHLLGRPETNHETTLQCFVGVTNSNSVTLFSHVTLYPRERLAGPPDHKMDPQRHRHSATSAGEIKHARLVLFHLTEYCRQADGQRLKRWTPTSWYGPTKQIEN